MTLRCGCVVAGDSPPKASESKAAGESPATTHPELIIPLRPGEQLALSFRLRASLQ